VTGNLKNFAKFFETKQGPSKLGEMRITRVLFENCDWQGREGHVPREWGDIMLSGGVPVHVAQSRRAVGAGRVTVMQFNCWTLGQ